MPPKKVKSPDELRQKMIGVKANQSEYDAIHEQAKRFGLSAPEFMRSVSMNYPIRSVIDEKAVADLLKTNADLGRLGGLLKMWLTRNGGDKDDFSAKRSYKDIDELVDEIEVAQKILKAQALKIMGVSDDR
ncbi:MAG: DNA transfer protein [Campylobacterota bacterium]